MLLSIVGFGLLLTTLQAFGTNIATERKQGWLDTLRITLLPTWVYLVAKVFVVLLLAGLGIGIAFGIGMLRLGSDEEPTRWALMAGCLLLGLIPLALLSFAIAYLFNAQVTQLMSVPILLVAVFTSDLLSLPAMPDWLSNAIPFSPFYHYSQLVQWAGQLNESAVTHLPLHLAWIGWAIALTGWFAAWAYRQNRTIG